MGNEDARKLALSTLRFVQYPIPHSPKARSAEPKPQSEATSKCRRHDLIPHGSAKGH